MVLNPLFCTTTLTIAFVKLVNPPLSMLGFLGTVTFEALNQLFPRMLSLVFELTILCLEGWPLSLHQ